jgi:hypothetical protein
VFVDPPPGGRGSGSGPVPLAVLELRGKLNELTGVERFAVAVDDGGDLLRRVRHQLVRLGDTGEWRRDLVVWVLVKAQHHRKPLLEHMLYYECFTGLV